MNSLLQIVQELALPFYGGLLLLAYGLGRYVQAHRVAAWKGGQPDQAAAQKPVPGFLLRLWEYLANPDETVTDAEVWRKSV